MHGKHRIEQMRQTDTMRFGNQSEQMPVAVEAPRAAVLHNLEARLVMAIEQFIGNTASWSFVGQLQRLGAKPLDADHGDYLVWQNASHCGSGLEVFEADHLVCSLILAVMREQLKAGYIGFIGFIGFKVPHETGIFYQFIKTMPDCGLRSPFSSRADVAHFRFVPAIRETSFDEDAYVLDHGLLEHLLE